MTNPSGFSRRGLIKAAGALAASAAIPAAGMAQEHAGSADTGPRTSTVEDRDRRMEWWHEARFGMFIHFGLYSVLGRHEWAMEEEEKHHTKNKGVFPSAVAFCGSALCCMSHRTVFVFEY